MFISYRILDPDLYFYPSRIPDRGPSGNKGPGSLVTGTNTLFNPVSWLIVDNSAQVLCEAGEPVPDHLPVRRVGEVQPGAPGHGRHRRKLHPDPALGRPEDTGQMSCSSLPKKA
jgi:hypothetical protein